MALHYFLLPLKILVLWDVLMEVNFRLVHQQRLIFNRKPLSFFTVLPTALQPLFYNIFINKNTSKYTFINPYAILASAQGRGGGGGGGGHGNDDWVTPNFRPYSNSISVQKKSKF
jgi:hypothetical protein